MRISDWSSDVCSSDLQGEPPLTAAFKGTRQVGFAVLASTAVVCAVFVPVMFLAGTTGLLFRELAAAMIGAVAFSGFLALTLTPMLCSKMIRKETRKGVSGWRSEEHTSELPSLMRISYA